MHYSRRACIPFGVALQTSGSSSRTRTTSSVPQLWSSSETTRNRGTPSIQRNIKYFSSCSSVYQDTHSQLPLNGVLGGNVTTGHEPSLLGINPSLRPRLASSVQPRSSFTSRSHEMSTVRSDGSSISSLGLTESEDNEMSDEEYQAREERRSPAAVYGSKRVGLEIIPHHLEQAILSAMQDIHPRAIREAFLSLLEPSTTSSKIPSRKGKSLSDHRADAAKDNGPIVAVAKAATILPGDYAVLRNVLGELRGRFGKDWLIESPGEGMVEVSGSLGPGTWALREQLNRNEIDAGASVKIKLIHHNRHGLDVAKQLLTGPGMSSELERHFVSFDRKLAPAQIEQPSLTLSTFYLSTLPTPASRQSHLKLLLSLNAPYLVIVDRATPAGWEAITEARDFVLASATTDEPLHLIAPCPHEGRCPLVGGRDRCSFSQRVQRTAFMRRTKHALKGDEDANYSYLIIGRGSRPISQMGDIFGVAGRVGGVGREELEKQRLKLEGKSELQEVEEGQYEMVLLQDTTSRPSSPDSPVQVKTQDVESKLQEEAYRWPRVVAPPLKRKGHVVIDACYPDGNIQRLTYTKSLSKQVYHDARKSNWGDIFPHQPKVMQVRHRGVRKLIKEEDVKEDNFMETSTVQVSDAEMADWPVAELVDADSEEAFAIEGQSSHAPDEDGLNDIPEVEVTTWKAGRITRGRFGQKREMSTLTGGAGLRLRPPYVASQRRALSARPVESLHSPIGPKPKVTLNTLRSLAAEKTPITCLTAFDYATALVSESAGIDMVLVGDSLSQVALGHSTTTAITIEEMIHHCKIVTRGAKSPFIFADMPFGTFEISVEEGVRNAIRMVKESGIEGVKIEGGREIIPLIRRLSDIGIPVIPHIGLQPQRAISLSGYLVQGRTSESALEIFETARLMREAGAEMILLEAIPHQLGSYTSESLDVITIGIGAGSGTHAQVLVITDVLGTYANPLPENGEVLAEGVMTGPPKPRFVRHFGRVGDEMRRAVEGFRDAVRERSFPEGKESYGIKKEQWEGFLRLKQAGETGAEGA